MVRKALKTEGLSPKAILAAVLPALTGVIGVVVQWAVTGEFDRAEMVTAIATAAGSLLAFVGAYIADPGEVVVDPEPAPVPGPALGGKA